jgi:uncharacterized protein YwqG
MTVDELMAAARACGFSPLDVLPTIARPAALLTPGPRHGDSDTHSQLGGLPALPGSVDWPAKDGTSLSFIAQIDLASQPRALAEQGFPSEGLLLFFYDAEQSTWGFDPNDRGSFAVTYVPDPSSAVLTNHPDDVPAHARYGPVPLASELTMMLPPWESVVVEELKLTRAQLDAYQALLERLGEDEEWANRCIVGGYPDQIQGDMTLECAMVSAGLFCGDGEAFKDPRRPELQRQATEWRLLLQVPSSEASGMMWGDAGCLYYWIRAEDLRARRFDRAWMILQCS